MNLLYDAAQFRACSRCRREPDGKLALRLQPGKRCTQLVRRTCHKVLLHAEQLHHFLGLDVVDVHKTVQLRGSPGV